MIRGAEMPLLSANDINRKQSKMAFGFLKKIAKAAGSVVTAPVKFSAKIVAAPIKLTGKVTGIKAIKSIGKFTEKAANPFTVAKTATKITGKVVSAPIRAVGKVTGFKPITKIANTVQSGISINPIANIKAAVNLTAQIKAIPVQLVGKATGVKAIKRLGDTLASPTASVKAVAKGTASIAQQVKKVPVVGKPLSAVINLGNAPVKLVGNVMNGERIDRAVLANLKEQAKSVKEIAPYARMCVSLIPGVGTVAAAAIAAGAALAEGQSITAAMVAGIKGAIPGGMIAQTAFSVSFDALSGKSITAATLNTLNLNTQQKDALKSVVTLSKDLGAGKAVSKPNIAKAQSLLPVEIQKAINIGIAVGFGQANQKKAVPAKNPVFKPTQPTQVEKMVAEGKVIVGKSPIMKAGLTTLKSASDQHGYYAAIGMMSHSATPAEISKFHGLLPKADDHGFTIGCAVVVGLKLIVGSGNDLLDFGAAVAKGINGAEQETKVAVVKTIAANQTAAIGLVSVAVQNKKELGWLRKILMKLGFIKEVAA